jgi:hypothetical protein
LNVKPRKSISTYGILPTRIFALVAPKGAFYCVASFRGLLKTMVFNFKQELKVFSCMASTEPRNTTSVNDEHVPN